MEAGQGWLRGKGSYQVPPGRAAASCFTGWDLPCPRSSMACLVGRTWTGRRNVVNGDHGESNKVGDKPALELNGTLKGPAVGPFETTTGRREASTMDGETVAKSLLPSSVPMGENSARLKCCEGRKVRKGQTRGMTSQPLLSAISRVLEQASTLDFGCNRGAVVGRLAVAARHFPHCPSLSLTGPSTTITQSMPIWSEQIEVPIQ